MLFCCGFVHEECIKGNTKVTNSHFSLQLENDAFKHKSGLYQLNLENIKIGFANKINLLGYSYLCRNSKHCWKFLF